jgi:hypothetical protein
MKNVFQGLMGDRSLTRLAAAFESEEVATEAARLLVQSAGLAPEQVRPLSPSMRGESRRLMLQPNIAPRRAGFLRGLWRAEWVPVTLGAVAGWAVYVGFASTGLRAVLGRPLASMAIVLALGASIGLLAGGAMAMWPDRERLFTRIRAALRGGRWVVVLHPTSVEQVRRAEEVLRLVPGELIRPL